MSATVRLPEKFRPRAWTLHATAGTATVTRYHVHWHGSLLPGEVVTVSLQLVTVQNVAKGWFLSTVTVRDGVTDPLVRSTRLWLPPYQAYLPAAFRAED